MTTRSDEAGKTATRLWSITAIDGKIIEVEPKGYAEKLIHRALERAKREDQP